MKVTRRRVEPPQITKRIADLEKTLARLEREMAPIESRYLRLQAQINETAGQWCVLMGRWRPGKWRDKR